MRALILRRVSLIESGAGGPILVGPATAPDMVSLQGFLVRNGHPHSILDPELEPDARALIERFGVGAGELPLVVGPDGSVLRNPTELRLARCIGLSDLRDEGKVRDLAIVGAGPAGLATTVYAASQGPSVVVLDARA